jgi:hypothetical protein
MLADTSDADAFLPGGDHAVAGAWPRETVERPKELPSATWIRQNADRWFVNRHDAPPDPRGQHRRELRRGAPRAARPAHDHTPTAVGEGLPDR